MPFKFNPITNKLDLVDISAPSGTDSLAGNTGLATESGGVINVPGDNTQGIDTTGSGDTLTITAFDATTSQKGTGELATAAEAIDGSATNNLFINPSSLSAKLGTQTSNSIPYGNSSSGAIQWTTALTNGQLVIGATGSDPLPANITSTGSTIDITNGPGTINIDTNGAIAETYTTDAGDATPSGGVINILGGTGISTSGATDEVTITAENNGDVVGPNGTADNVVPSFDGSSGKLLKSSGLTVTNAFLALSTGIATSTGFLILNTSGSGAGFCAGQYGVLITADVFSSYQIILIGINWVIGVDATNNNFKTTIGGSSPSNGTTVSSTTTAGERIRPVQPAFLVYMDTTVTDVTGDGTAYGPVVFDTEVFDQGTDMSSGTFTAPVAGRYRFSYSVLVNGGTTITAAVSSLFTSNRQYDQYESVSIAGTTEVICQFSMLVDMDASDTAYVIIETTDSGGKIDDISGLITNVVSSFSGELVF